MKGKAHSKGKNLETRGLSSSLHITQPPMDQYAFQEGFQLRFRINQLNLPKLRNAKIRTFVSVMSSTMINIQSSAMDKVRVVSIA